MKTGKIESLRPTHRDLPTNPEDKNDRADKGRSEHGQEGITYGYVNDETGDFYTHLLYHGDMETDGFTKEVLYKHIDDG